MKNTPITAVALGLLLAATGCQKETATGLDKLEAVNTIAYTPVTETPTTKTINSALLGGTDFTFDTHQAWFDFRTISSTVKGTAAKRTDWHLGFWANNGSVLVNGSNNSSLAILNYSVNTQAKEITGAATLAAARAQTTQLNNAVTLFDGGTFGMGDLSTFDFHRESQFVFGTPTTAGKIYLVRTQPVQIHPDTTATSTPVTVNYFLVRLALTSTGYTVQHQAVEPSSWANVGSQSAVISVSKSDNAYQYKFYNLQSKQVLNLQPTIGSWNLGLSAVVLKRYINPAAGGGAYPFAVKGVVLNNNPAVKIYRVQSTGTTAGAPGPFDPNYSWSSDPALDATNDIASQFNSFSSTNIDDSKFSSNSQEEIGQYWRYLDMGNYRVFVDRFYVIKLANGDVYKLKFNKIGSAASTPINDGIQITYAKIATTP